MDNESFSRSTIVFLFWPSCDWLAPTRLDAVVGRNPRLSSSSVVAVDKPLPLSISIGGMAFPGVDAFPGLDAAAEGAISSNSGMTKNAIHSNKHGVNESVQHGFFTTFTPYKHA